MIYEMKLSRREFNNIKYNNKIIEVRLNDEKRKLIQPGDRILFRKVSNIKESILVEVKDINKFSSFRQLYEFFPISYFGKMSSNVSEMLEKIYKIYSKDQEEKYGVMAIKFTIVNNMI